jgi:hypothetical protein
MRKKAKKLAAKGPCRVYWSSHGCQKQRGHKGRHYCENTCPRPGNEWFIFGEDIGLYPCKAGDPKP